MIGLGDLAGCVAELRGDALVVTGPGAISGALWSAGHDPATIYNMELAYASAVAMGAAIAQPNRRCLALEGDGSLLAGLPVLATAARSAPANLTIVVIVNGIYGTGDNRTPTQTGLGADLADVALALGWDQDHVRSVGSVEDLRSALTGALTSLGPWFIAVSVDPASYGASGKRARPGVDIVEAAVLCRRYLAGEPAGGSAGDQRP